MFDVGTGSALARFVPGPDLSDSLATKARDKHFLFITPSANHSLPFSTEQILNAKHGEFHSGRFLNDSLILLLGVIHAPAYDTSDFFHTSNKIMFIDYPQACVVKWELPAKSLQPQPLINYGSEVFAQGNQLHAEDDGTILTDVMTSPLGLSTKSDSAWLIDRWDQQGHFLRHEIKGLTNAPLPKTTRSKMFFAANDKHPEYLGFQQWPYFFNITTSAIHPLRVWPTPDLPFLTHEVPFTSLSVAHPFYVMGFQSVINGCCVLSIILPDSARPSNVFLVQHYAADGDLLKQASVPEKGEAGQLAFMTYSPALDTYLSFYLDGKDGWTFQTSKLE